MGGDDGSLGSGPSVVAGFGYRITSRLSLEVFVVGSLGVLHSDITQTYPIAGGTRTFTRNESSFAWGEGPA